MQSFTAPYSGKFLQHLNNFKKGQASDDDDIDLSYSFMLTKNATKTTGIPTTKVNSANIVYPDNEKLITKPTDHKKIGQIVTATVNKDPSKIVFPDQLIQTTGNTDEFTFQPMATTPPTTMMGNGPYQNMNSSATSYTYANCGAMANAESRNISVSADSQFVVFPNGTKVSISKCHVQVIVNRNKS